MKGKTILFLDDDKSVMTNYATILKRREYRLIEFSQVDKAFEYIRSGKPKIDLAIIDVLMKPGKTYPLRCTSQGIQIGLRFANDFRSRYEMAPIVLLTNMSDLSDLAALDDSLGKTIFIQKLEYPPVRLANTVSGLLANI